MKLAGKVAIITGVSFGRGMSKGFAHAFAKEGASLALNYFKQNKEEIEALKEEIESYGGKVVFVEGDISEEETAEKLIEKAIESFGKIDILLNNAAITHQALVQDLSIDDWERMLKVNLTSVFLTVKHAVPHMIKQKSGRIINMASQIAQKGGVQHCHYAAAKAGIIGFTKSLALELGEYGITANCIAPGPIDTQLMDQVNETWRKKKESELVIPRFGRIEEVVPTAILLASDPDGNIYTGQTLGPNSGDVMP